MNRIKRAGVGQQGGAKTSEGNSADMAAPVIKYRQLGANGKNL